MSTDSHTTIGVFHLETRLNNSGHFTCEAPDLPLRVAQQTLIFCRVSPTAAGERLRAA
jgi:hypothetical protein